MAKSKSSSIEESWTRINQWLRSERKAASLAKKLLPGVPEKALERVEKRLGVKLPADLRQFWQLCGGSRPDKGAEEIDDEPWWQPGEWSSDFFPRGIPETMAFSILSPRAALEAWERLQEWEGFDRRLLPIAGDGGGDYQCVNVLTKSSAHHMEKKAVIPASHKEMIRQYPITGLVEGWYFRQEEVSAGCYIVWDPFTFVERRFFFGEPDDFYVSLDIFKKLKC